jgi:hypothetical protein
MSNSALQIVEEEMAVRSLSDINKFNPLDHPISFLYPGRVAVSAWMGHVPFGMYLIDVLRPKAIVELGTHYGVSFCAFCQAVKELGLETHCYAVDSWEGDAHSGFYGPEVLTDLEEYHNPAYGDFSRLIKSTFDEALGYFADHTFDLLHLDGFHTYEAVKQDFEKWLPKLTDRGIVLIHDINVREREFGVWKFWEELKPQFPHFEFIHSHGLGVLAVGKSYPDELNELFHCSAEEAIKIRSCFAYLGARLETAKELKLSKAETSELRQQLAENYQSLRTKDLQLQEMDQSLRTKDLQLQEMDQSLRTKDLQLQGMEQQLTNKDQRVQAMEEGILVHLQSPSYRIGRALTWPLRSVKSLFG